VRGWKPALAAVVALAAVSLAMLATASGPAVARPVSTTTHPVVAQLEADTGVVPQEICGPPGTGCGSVEYLESGHFNFYDPVGQHIEGQVSWLKASNACALSLIVPALLLTAIPIGGWIGVGGIAATCVGAGIIEILTG
jgi:hypothetical protein